jgi:hypothetical protein
VREGFFLFFNLFGYDLEFFQGLWTWDIFGVTPASNNNAPEAALIVPSVK